MSHPRRLRLIFPRIVTTAATLLALMAGAQTAGDLNALVRDADGRAVASATVRVQGTDGHVLFRGQSDGRGMVRFPAPGAGQYEVVAEKDGAHGQTPGAAGGDGMIVVRLEPKQTGGAMQFSDEPSFTVAGVTDWTAVGGHGSDTSLRTSEAMAKETVKLQTPGEDVPAGENVVEALRQVNARIAQRDDADLHRVRGELEEKRGDALAAVRDFETAVRMRPSEENYFAWGSELLLHRAVLQAEEVLSAGAQKYPTSLRMQVALATALFSGARYGEAAERLCRASDLDGSNQEVIAMMGRVQIAAPDALACIDDRLSRYEQSHPENGEVKYFEAMALMKRDRAAGSSARVEKLLSAAVEEDPKCAEAYLALGNLSAERKDFAGAIKEYERAIAANPKMADAHYRLGVALDRSGDHAKAAQEFALHDALAKTEAESVDRERREIKQFQVTGPGQTVLPPGI